MLKRLGSSWCSCRLWLPNRCCLARRWWRLHVLGQVRCLADNRCAACAGKPCTTFSAATKSCKCFVPTAQHTYSCVLGNAGDPALAGRTFPVLVCDEATQATEPATLVAVSAQVRGWNGHGGGGCASASFRPAPTSICTKVAHLQAGGCSVKGLNACNLTLVHTISSTPGVPISYHSTLPAKVLEALHQGCTNSTSPATPPVLQTSSLLLVGDPQQLPPTVRSREAAGLGLGVTLLQRLTAMGLEPLLLDTQYRMHPGGGLAGC